MEANVAAVVIEHVRQAGIRPTTLTAAAALALIRAWALERGWAEDKKGDLLVNDAQRWHFRRSQTLHQVKGRGGTWLTQRAWLSTSLARQLVMTAAEVLAEQDLIAAWAPAEEQGEEAATERRRRADRARIEEAASVIAMKRMAWEHQAEAIAISMGQALPEMQARRLEEKQREYAQAYEAELAAGRPGPSDGAFATAERPPVLPLYGVIAQKADRLRPQRRAVT